MAFSLLQENNRENFGSILADNDIFMRLKYKFEAINNTITDPRTGKNIKYKLNDVISSAYAVTFYQFNSLLEFNNSLKDTSSFLADNSMPFINHEIPSGNNITRILDNIDYRYFDEMLINIIDELEDKNKINQFKVNNKWLCMGMDGTQTITSSKNSCEKCTVKKHKSGTVTYSHSAVAVSIVDPINHLDPIVFPSEMVMNQDGQEKQDCERNKAKELIPKIANCLQKKHEDIVLLGDDLYSCNSICKLVEENRLFYIFTAKEKSHKTIEYFVKYLDPYEFTIKKKLAGTNIVEEITIKYYTDIPIKAGKSTKKLSEKDEEIVITNFMSVTAQKYKIIKNTKVKLENHFYSTYITNIDIGIDIDEVKRIINNKDISNITIKDTIETLNNSLYEIFQMGRSRWDIENLFFNVMKNRGYNLTHRFGHGKTGNAYYVYTALNILAFSMHNALKLLIPDIYNLLNMVNEKKNKWRSFIYIMIHLYNYMEIMEIIEKKKASKFPKKREASKFPKKRKASKLP